MSRRMRISVKAQPQIVFALIRVPHLGPTQEEALLRRKSVNFLFARLRIFIERFLQGGIRQLHATYVRDVFAKG